MSLDFAREMATLGVPVFAMPPCGRCKGVGCSKEDRAQAKFQTACAGGYVTPTGWQRFTADSNESRLKVWREGYALAMVCGSVFDVVDTDLQNDGEAGRAGLDLPTVYVTVRTPSGGTHEYVAAVGLAKGEIAPGVDYQAGAADGSGVGFVFLPGTRKTSKTTGVVGAGYVVEERRRLDLVLEHGSSLVVPDEAWRSSVAAGRASMRPARRVSVDSAAPAGKSAKWGSVVVEIGRPIEMGQHDNTLTAFAAALRAHGAEYDEACELIAKRALDCVPPWSGPDEPSSKVATAWQKFNGPCACSNGFCDLAVHTAERDARMLEAGRAWSPRLSGAPDDSDEDAEGPEGVYLSEEFWAARPVFGVLRQAAHKAMASPEGVLVAALGMTLANVMPNVWLPACVGVEASLNVMIVTCGASGDGKSVCRKIAKQTLVFAGIEPVWEFPPSSGQGIAGQYQRPRKTKGEEGVMETLRYNALAMVEESDKIAALAAQASNTLSSELRAASMGEIIGSGNIGDTKTNMPEGSYRFVLAMCMQPELSGWLLDEKAGGLPQRFLFACVNDARVVRTEGPGTWTVRLPLEATPDPVSGVPRTRVVMGVTDAICAEIQAETIARKLASVRMVTTKQYDGHGTLLRLKVAGAIALLDGRLDITDEDWGLAGEVTAASKATIRWMQSIQADGASRRVEAFRKVKAADATAIKSAEIDVTEGRFQASCRSAVERKLRKQGAVGMLKSDLKEGLSPRQNEVLEEVMGGLLSTGSVRLEDIFPKGSRWFWLS